jgi:hypothetical protein
MEKSSQKMEAHLEMCNPGATCRKNLSKIDLSNSAKFFGLFALTGAGDGDRTRDVQLGKLAFYR